jgi:DNA-binding NarL/FixJ family response regulator
MTRVALVDDQALLRAGFRALIEAEDDLEVVGEAADGKAAVRLTEELRPDVLLLDVQMPEADGLEAARRVLSPGSTHAPKVLMLTTFDLDEYVFGALRAGASGFLLKTTPPGELAEAIRACAAGEQLFAPTVTRRLVEAYVSRGPRTAGTPPRLAALTDRELDVLRELARGLSNAEIAAALYLGETTVKTHVTRILAKLGLRDRVQAVVLAYECGLVEPSGT